MSDLVWPPLSPIGHLRNTDHRRPFRLAMPNTPDAFVDSPLRAPEDVGEVAISLLAELSRGDIIFLARDEQRAGGISRALAAAAPHSSVLFCPGSDALPGESSPPSPANTGQRVSALRKLRALQQAKVRTPIALITTGEAAARLYPTPEIFDAAPPILRVGDPCDLEALAAELVSIGYAPDDRVDEPGELALRGQVIDVFPADAGEPCRIQVQDGRIISIRPYDSLSQMTTDDWQLLEVGRASEPALEQGITLLDHLPGAEIAWDKDADLRRRRFLALALDAGHRRPRRALRDVCADEQWQAAAARHPALEIGIGLGLPPPRLVEAKNPARAFSRFANDELEAGHKLVLIGTARDLRFLAGRATKLLKRVPEPIKEWQHARDAQSGAVLQLEMPLSRGFRMHDIVAVAATDVLGSRAQRDDGLVAPLDAEMFRLGDVKVGDIVVHEDHGLAAVAGLEMLPGGGDAIVLRFASDARRLVSIIDANRLWRYGADEGAVTLDKLDGSTWAKRRGEIDAAIAETARSLVVLAEENGSRTAPTLEPSPATYESFAAGFPFTETPDQARAIAAVRDDLAAGKPMNRLIIGDVGYGKTEVALRAAAISALAGKQVAVAAPTTVLARQHLETFAERFEAFGIEVAGLSRLESAAEKKRVKAGLKDGSIQIVVGTGAVAGAGVEYKDLGLVIIDEEQRFGTADKKKLAAMGSGHVLTLSATPIPRTLQQALVGLQQMSVIATPPARRQPIRTAIATFDDQVVRTALLRERSRGGQSFFVVPRIEDLADIGAKLRQLVPELELLEAHGKMPPAEVDEAMVRFARGEGDVLLATNIIEAGLDVPRANTMLVWKADRFGLAQLHQLRGRVGRGARRGQIYLLTEEGAELSPRTLSRLQALQAFDRLGAGFAISARDLDMRGAGDLLGEEQAGHVKLIGVDLYQHLLEQALRRARGETVDDWQPVLNVGAEGRIPTDWIPDLDLRISLYARLARVASVAELENFEEELADRFGEIPPEGQSLLTVARLGLLARAAGMAKVDAGPAAIALTPKNGADRQDIPAGLNKKNGRWLLTGDHTDELERLDAVEALLMQLDGS